jgi:hypothetical protein
MKSSPKTNPEKESSKMKKEQHANENPTLVLSLQGGQLVATDKDNHSVAVPLDVNGLRVLRGMLIAKRNLPEKFASYSQPTQLMIEDFLRDKKLEKKIEQEKQTEELKKLF